MARRRPSLRFQLTLLGTALVGLVVLAFLAEGDSGGPGTASTTTASPTSTGTPGFPPADPASICRTLLTGEEAEALVGRALPHPVIEPQSGQCAWPTDPGNPRDAELFFEVLPQGEVPLTEELAEIFEGLPHRLDRVDALVPPAADAYFVTRLADERLEIERDFVEGIYVYHREFVVILASGGRDIWDGGDEAVKERLRTAMETVLDRIDTALVGS